MWIKICGITNIDDALSATTAGVDAIGLNFFHGSKRYVAPATAASIAEAVRAGSFSLRPDLVGVFVNSDADEIVQTVREVKLDAVQFHGEESAELIRRVHEQSPGVALIRAMRVSADRLEVCLRELESLSKSVPLTGCLLDAYVPGEYGGTGHQLGSDLADALKTRLPSRLILAGGLKPDNVAAAVRAFGPWGVDTASGVEVSPGHKDASLMRSFIREARGEHMVERLSSAVL
ncbi:MAG: phosphoribosylanthranilate isomerase [Planctomycetaceae bacterium]|nr:phosphoribosylanthranilate isomerase [Planctomycetaceae bacterium]